MGFNPFAPMIIKTSIGFSQKELNGFCILTDKKISAKALAGADL